jgi:aminopeptidase N
MEYPMITFINHRDDPMSLNGTTTHELSHIWVPMIVGTKENPYPRMDEGFTTNNTALAQIDYYGDETPEGRTRVGAMSGYLNVVRAGAEVPIMRHTDYAENGFGRSIAAYSKPGMLMHALRHMMGEDAFDAAYRDYIETWSYKHPMPWDFFAMMEEAAGTDLDWFWQSWYYGTETMDQAIEAVEVVEGGVRVTVSTEGGAVMPVELRLELEGGETVTTTWPVGVWAEGRKVTRLVPTAEAVRNVHVDPDAWYPDIDRSNNDWERPGA